MRYSHHLRQETEQAIDIAPVVEHRDTDAHQVAALAERDGDALFL